MVVILFEIHMVFPRGIEVIVAQSEFIAAIVGLSDFPYLHLFEKADSFLSHLALYFSIICTKKRLDRWFGVHRLLMLFVVVLLPPNF